MALGFMGLCFKKLNCVHSRGMNVLEAVTGFLRKVRELDTYGVQLYDMRFDESPCQLGITPGGISIFRRNRRIHFHDWDVVAEVSFKNKKLMVVLTPSQVYIITLITLYNQSVLVYSLNKQKWAFFLVSG